MNSKHHIPTVTLLILMSGCCLQSCQEEDDILTAMPINRDTLIAQGRYLTTEDVGSYAMGDITDKPQPFKEGTPYRLLAFTRPYDANNPNNETSNPQNGENTDNPQSGENIDNPPSTPITPIPRFNKVAWEGRSPEGIRFININHTINTTTTPQTDLGPDVLLGFSALDGEDDTGTNGLVSLDFYGFTYGLSQNTHPSDYLELDGLTGETTPAKGALPTLCKTENVTKNVTTNEPNDSVLNDLRWGRLLNQNITTAGADNDSTQSVIPFKHCFSKLRFQVSQQGEEDENGNPTTPIFTNLKLVDIKVTGTYGNGKVYLQDGKVEVSGDKIHRTLKIKDGFDGNIGINDADVGDMLIYPSHNSALKNTSLTEGGYKVGLKITVKSTVKQDILNMLRNTSSDQTITVSEPDADGNVWYQGTITKTEITDYYSPTPTTLYFKQNASYMIIIAFHKNDVRIITVIPMVEDWLQGEGNNPNDPWEYQDMGQPQMFDNVVWSDRNLGADYFDPSSAEHYEETIGYFYQGGRNIPYYPFEFSWRTNWTYYEPDFRNINNQNMGDHYTDWHHTDYRFFPVVDSEIRNMTVRETVKETITDENGVEQEVSRENTYQPNSWTFWDGGQAQMMIPEQRPTSHNFNFCTGLKSNNDMHWDKGQQYQPISGAWVLPTMKDFLTIFPSTPYAGNIVFNKVGEHMWSGDWGLDGDVGPDGDGPIFQMDDDVDVIRVTVPYFKTGSTTTDQPTGKSAKYIEAWNTLLKNNDDGTTHLEKYTQSDGKNGSPDKALYYEPNGDPEDGYASVYVISRAVGKKVFDNVEYNVNDTVMLPEIYTSQDDNGKDRFVVKSWGTIYAIKRIYTSGAYRMRWRALLADKWGAINPSIYIEICRYRCKPTDTLTEENYFTYDWDHPAARIYFPVCGMGDYSGEYINYGIECVYATSDPIIDGGNGKYYMNGVQIKLTGNNASNAFISVMKGASNRLFGMQIRPVGGGY